MKITFEFTDEELSADATKAIAAFLTGAAPKPAATRRSRGGKSGKTAETAPPEPEAPPAEPTPPPGDAEDFAEEPKIPTLTELRKAMTDCANSYPDPADGRAKAVALLAKFDAPNASKLEEGQRATVIAELAKIHYKAKG